MGVVKNLMVRIGADVRGIVGGMKTAYNSTRQATSQIRNATAGMKQSVKDSFSGSRISIREYKEAVSNLKAAHNTAAQNTERLQDKLEQMQATYESLKSATAGIDLSTPLAEQIREAETSWHGFLNEAQKVKEALKKELSLDSTKSDPDKIDSLRHDLQLLRTAASEAELELRKLKSVASAIGADNISFASVSGMDTLQDEIKQIQRDLDISKIKTGELGQKLKSLSIPNLIKTELKSIGAAAGAAARAGLKEMGNRLIKIGVSGLKGIASLPAMLLSIGRSAAAGNSSLEKMVRSIRNIGIVALGLRSVSSIFRGVFGELQGIISSYVSQNEELNASITNMKNQLGQALAPAINVVIAAMQKLMPLIQTAANVVNAIFTRLFGSVRSTTSAIRSSAKAATSAAEATKSSVEEVKSSVEEATSALDKLHLYSFDQINKVSDNTEKNSSIGSSDDSSSTSGTSNGGIIGTLIGSGKTPAWLNSVLLWIDQLKAAFKAGDWVGLGKIFGDGINAAVNAINAVDIGTKVGTFVNNFFTTLNSALGTIDFFGMGKKLGEFVTAGFNAVNWSTVGETIGRAITAIPSIVVGFIQNTDWKLVATSLSNALTSMLKTITEWFRTVDWSKVGEAIGTFLANINWIEIFKSLGALMWEGFKAALEMLAGFIKGLGPGMILAAISAAISVVCLKIAGDSLKSALTNAFVTLVLPALKKTLSTAVSAIVSAIGGWPALIIAAAAAAVAVIALWLKGGGADVVGGFLEGMKEGIANIGASLSGAWESIGAFLDTRISDLWAKLEQGWARIKTSTASCWKEICSSVTERLKLMYTSSVQQIGVFRQMLVQNWSNIRSDAGNYVSQMAQSVETLFATLWANSVKVFSDLKNDLQRIWTSITAQLRNCLSTMFGLFQNTHTQLQNNTESSWQSILKTITSKTEGIFSVVEKFRTQLSSGFSKLNMAVSNAMTIMVGNIASGFANVLTKVQNCINSIISAVSKMVNSIVDAVSRAMQAIARLKEARSSLNSTDTSSTGSSNGSVSGVIGGFVSRIFGTSTHLATGGITTGPTYALIGESGKEAVMPLERNTGWMDTLAQRIVTAGGGSQQTPVVLKIYLGGKKISQHVIKDINSITQTTGVCPINV